LNAKVVIPIYRTFLTEEERISILSIRKSFSGDAICFVAPESLDLHELISGEEQVERFDDSFFDGIEGYNRLLTSSTLYERFATHSHMLICQLDCLVFRNALEEWVEKGFDYIAAPWFQKFLEDPAGGLWRVGNGGFSLRNVTSHQRVLQQRIMRGVIYPNHGVTPWEVTRAEDELGLYQKLMPWYRRMNPFTEWTTIEKELCRFPMNEDLFWALEAPKFDSSFKVATPDEALPFAFEVAPRWCYEKNGRNLPFGCHAWARYDRSFWEEILRGGSIIPK